MRQLAHRSRFTVNELELESVLLSGNESLVELKTLFSTLRSHLARLLAPLAVTALPILIVAMASPAFAETQSENGGDDPTSLSSDPTRVSVPWHALRQERLYEFEPSIALVHGHWHTSHERPSTQEDLHAVNARDLHGVEIGAKLLTDSDTSHHFLIGFDLRELLAWDPNLVTDLRFGLRVEVRPGGWWPDFGASWFFGDLYRPVARGMQFSGTSWALSLSKKWRVARWGIEYNFGAGSEGGGFIDRGVQGTHQIQTESLQAFVKFPFAVEY